MLRLTTAGTPAWKMGLIPVLAAILFKVTRTAPPEVEVPGPVAAAEAQSSESHAATPPATVLPDLSLTDALKCDPFAPLPGPERPPVEAPPIVEAPVPEIPPAPETPETPAVPAISPLVEKAASLKRLKVSAVFPSPKGSVAIIDSQTVRVGDLLSPGVRVVEIRGTDVILRVEDGGAAAGAESTSAALR